MTDESIEAKMARLDADREHLRELFDIHEKRDEERQASIMETLQGVSDSNKEILKRSRARDEKMEEFKDSITAKVDKVETKVASVSDDLKAMWPHIRTIKNVKLGWKVAVSIGGGMISLLVLWSEVGDTVMGWLQLK